MSTYAISDIHGCYRELLLLLEKIRFSDDDELYIIGDLLDKGPDSSGVAKWFIEAGKNVHLIRGNHDTMMIDDTGGNYKDLPLHRDSVWAYNSGFETAEDLYENMSVEERKRLFEKVSAAPTLAEISVNERDFVLVHAGLMPPKGKRSKRAWIDGTSDWFRIWIRGGWLDTPRKTPFITVFGHTMTDSIIYYNEHGLDDFWSSEYIGKHFLPKNDYKDGRFVSWNNKVAIDCGCHRGYALGALRLDDLEEFYVDATENTIENMLMDLPVPIADWYDALSSNTHGYTGPTDNDRYQIIALWRMYMGKVSYLTQERLDDAISKWKEYDPDKEINL